MVRAPAASALAPACCSPALASKADRAHAPRSLTPPPPPAQRPDLTERVSSVPAQHATSTRATPAPLHSPLQPEQRASSTTLPHVSAPPPPTHTASPHPPALTPARCPSPSPARHTPPPTTICIHAPLWQVMPSNASDALEYQCVKPASPSQASQLSAGMAPSAPPATPRARAPRKHLARGGDLASTRPGGQNPRPPGSSPGESPAGRAWPARWLSAPPAACAGAWWVVW